jgi:hypothetical protein
MNRAFIAILLVMAGGGTAVAAPPSPAVTSFLCIGTEPTPLLGRPVELGVCLPVPP